MRNSIKNILKASVALLVTALMVSWGTAQAGNSDNTKSKDQVSLSGTVIVKSNQGSMSKQETQYFLDKDNDGKADYQLQWEQQKADFSAPKDGDNVSVTGTMSGNSKAGLPIIQVNKLNEKKASSSDNGMGGSGY